MSDENDGSGSDGPPVAPDRSLQPVGTTSKLTAEEQRALGLETRTAGLIRWTREKSSLAAGFLAESAKEAERFLRYPVLLALAGTGLGALAGFAGFPLYLIGGGVFSAGAAWKIASEIAEARRGRQDMTHRWENFPPRQVVRHAKDQADRLISQLSKPQAKRLKHGLRARTRRDLPALLARYHWLSADLHRLRAQGQKAYDDWRVDQDTYRKRELAENINRINRVIEVYERRKRETGERVTQILLYIERYAIALKLASISDDAFADLSAEVEAFFLDANFEIDGALEVQEALDADRPYRELREPRQKPDSET